MPLSWLAGFCVPRGSIHRGCEVLVATATASATSNDESFAWAFELADDPVRVAIDDDRAQRKLHLSRRSALPVAVFPLAVAAVIGSHDVHVIKVVQGSEPRIGNEDYVSAATTVSAGWAAEGHEFLSAKRNTAVTAVAGDDLDLTFVDEAHGGATLACSVRRGHVSPSCFGDAREFLSELDA
jgi:hypothetical protein